MGMRRKRRSSTLLGPLVGAALLVIAGITITVTGVFGTHDDDQAMPAYLPSDQPACPAVMPTGSRTGGLLAGTAPRATLGTVCQYNTTTRHLKDPGESQIRPVDLPDFLSFIRHLNAAPSATSACGTTGSTVAVSVQLLGTDGTVRSMTTVSFAHCVAVSDGSTTLAIPLTALSDSWGQMIDPALPASQHVLPPDGGATFATPPPTLTGPSSTAPSTGA